MTNSELAKSYFIKASKRLKVLYLLKEEKAYSDVIREAQEVVELSLKGMLREIGVEPPKWHDVGHLIIEFKKRFPKEVSHNVEKLVLRLNNGFTIILELSFPRSLCPRRRVAGIQIKKTGFRIKSGMTTL